MILAFYIKSRNILAVDAQMVENLAFVCLFLKCFFFLPADKVIFMFSKQKTWKTQKSTKGNNNKTIPIPLSRYKDNMVYVLPVVFIKVLSFCTQYLEANIFHLEIGS